MVITPDINLFSEYILESIVEDIGYNTLFSLDELLSTTVIITKDDNEKKRLIENLRRFISKLYSEGALNRYVRGYYYIRRDSMFTPKTLLHKFTNQSNIDRLYHGELNLFPYFKDEYDAYLAEQFCNRFIHPFHSSDYIGVISGITFQKMLLGDQAPCDGATEICISSNLETNTKRMLHNVDSAFPADLNIILRHPRTPINSMNYAQIQILEFLSYIKLENLEKYAIPLTDYIQNNSIVFDSSIVHEYPALTSKKYQALLNLT